MRGLPKPGEQRCRAISHGMRVYWRRKARCKRCKAVHLVGDAARSSGYCAKCRRALEKEREQ